MSDKKSELEKLGNWVNSWGSSLYKSTTGKTLPEQPQRESLAPRIYTTLTGKQYPSDPNPVYSQRKPASGKKSLPENRYRDRERTGITRMGGVTYDLSIPHHRDLYNAAIKSNQDAIPDERKGDPRGGGGLTSAGKTKPLPESGGGRVAPAPDGNGSTGTQLSPRQMTMDEANALLTGGYRLSGPFSSTQLPTTNASPYFKDGKAPQLSSEAPDYDAGVQLSSNMTDGSPFNTDGYKYEVPTNTNIEYLQQDGSPKIALSGAASSTSEVNPGNTKADTPEDKRTARIPKRPKGERAAAMWDRQYGRMDQSTSTSETKGSGIDYARRAAFLDAPSSLQGLRRVEAQKDIFYQGGQHHMVNPNHGQEGQSDFLKISKEDRDAYMGGRLTASGLKDKYVQNIVSNTEDPTDTPDTPTNYTLTPEVDVKTAGSQRPAIEVDTSVLTQEVDYQSPPIQMKRKPRK